MFKFEVLNEESSNRVANIEGDHALDSALIIGCVGTLEDYADELPPNFSKMREMVSAAYKEPRAPEERPKSVIIPGVDNLDYSADDIDKDRAGLQHAGLSEYVLSSVNSNDKFSADFYTCIGIVAVGTDRETGENISFALHTPAYQPGDETDDLILNKLAPELEAKLLTLKERCIEGSIDAVMVGGKINFAQSGDLDKNIYEKTKDFLTSKVESALGIYPVSIAGPKEITDKNINSYLYLKEGSVRGDEFYFDNMKRRLFLLRPDYTKDPEIE